MLAMIVYLLEVLRRTLKKSGRGLFIVADAFNEALDGWRKAKGKYPFTE